MRGKNDQGRELRLDVTALVRQLRLYAGSEYAGTFIDRNPTVTRLLAAMVLEPDNEEQRRPPDDRGLVVSLRDRILRAAPSQERNYLDGWFAVHSSTLGWLSYLLIQARPRSWQPVASGRVTGERGSFSVVLGARPAQQPQGEKSPLGWMREVIQIREVVHPAPSLGSAVDFLEQFLSSEGLGPDNLTAGSGRIYRDGQPFAVILLEPQLAVWEADPAWKPTKRLASSLRSCGRRGEVAMQGALGDPKESEDWAAWLLWVLGQGLQQRQLVFVELTRPPALSAPSSGSRQPGRSALTNECALKLSDGAEDLKNQAAGCPACVHAFRQRDECDFPLAEVVDGAQQILQRPGEPIEPPHHKRVPGSAEGERLLQARPGRVAARELVGVDPLAAGGLERIYLRVQVLIGARHSRIANFHGPRVPQPIPGVKFWDVDFGTGFWDAFGARWLAPKVGRGDVPQTTVFRTLGCGSVHGAAAPC